ncbi:unnamed protein product [Prunus armeniaca]
MEAVFGRKLACKIRCGSLRKRGASPLAGLEPTKPGGVMAWDCSREPALRSIQGVVPKLLNEIRFFHNYAHRVAISDSCGEMLRDVYQMPNKRVHVIVNGVNEADFSEDQKLGQEFRSLIGISKNGRDGEEDNEEEGGAKI